jgi:hypothetical protein
MTISYKWLDAAQTSLRLTNTETPNVVTSFPAVAGNRDYAAYLTWVAGGGVTGTYVYPGYDTVNNARVTRTLEAEAALHAFLESEHLLFKMRRAEYGGGYSLSSADTTKIQNAYGRYVTFLGALAGSTNITNIRTSTIDYVADTHNVA